MRARVAFGMMVAMTATVFHVASFCPGDERTDRLVEDVVARAKTNPERAASLCKAAEAIRDERLKAGLFEKAVEYGLKGVQDPNTRLLIEKALAALPGLDPNNADVYNAQKVDFYRAWLASAKADERLEVTQKYTGALITLARELEDGRRWKEAKAAYQVAHSTAIGARLLAIANDAQEGVARCGEMEVARLKADNLAASLAKDPNDARSRLALVEALVVAMDEPNEAVQYLNQDLPESWRLYTSLAASAGASVARAACREIGDWYWKELLPKAKGAAKVNMEARAEGWYQRVLNGAEEDELSARARVALGQIEEARTNRSSRPADYIATFVRNRDAQPPAKQVEMIQQALAELSRGSNAKVVHHETDKAGKHIVSLDLDGTDLLTLEPLTGLPLESLTVGSGRAGKYWPAKGCPMLRDLSGLSGMPLKSLGLYAPSLPSLRGLKGLKLESLTLKGCKGLSSLEGLEGMPLKEFQADGLPALKGLLALKGMPLENLSVSHVESLTSVEGLEKLPLATVVLYYCPLVTSLKGLNTEKLTNLTLYVTGIKSLEGLAKSPLTELVVDYTPITSLEGLVGNKTLNKLTMEGCNELKSLAGLEDSPLTELSMNSPITTLAPLKGNKTLTKLMLRDISTLTSLEGVETMPLTEAKLMKCPNLSPEELERLKKIPTLKNIER